MPKNKQKIDKSNFSCQKSMRCEEQIKSHKINQSTPAKTHLQNPLKVEKLKKEKNYESLFLNILMKCEKNTFKKF